MIPADLIPPAQAIPIPFLWFDILLVATFIIHILLMNIVLGTAFISFVTLCQKQDLALPKQWSKHLPTLLALTINCGVAPLLFVQVVYGSFNYVASVLMGGLWLSMIALLLGAYYGLYVYKLKFSSLAAWRKPMLIFSFICLLCLAFLFSTNATLMLRPEQWLAYFSKQGSPVLNFTDPSFLPRWLHFIVAAPAVGGLFIAFLGSERGLRWFTWTTLLNIPIGLWFLFSLPKNIMQRFFGGHAAASVFVDICLILIACMLWAGFKKKLKTAAALLMLTVSLMAVMRHLLRLFTLEPFFDPSSLEVSYEISSLLFFLFALAVGAAVIIWMLKTYFQSAYKGDA